MIHCFIQWNVHSVVEGLADSEVLLLKKFNKNKTKMEKRAVGEITLFVISPRGKNNREVEITH